MLASMSVPGHMQLHQQLPHQMMMFNNGGYLGNHQVPKVQKSHSRQKKSRGPSTRRSCGHNNWDNIRAEKQCIALRCRVCQKQHRVALKVGWKCKDFNTKDGCTDPTCTKYHVHFRKQNLEERVRIHGANVLNFSKMHGSGQMDLVVRVRRELDKVMGDTTPQLSTDSSTVASTIGSTIDSTPTPPSGSSDAEQPSPPQSPVAPPISQLDFVNNYFEDDNIDYNFYDDLIDDYSPVQLLCETVLNHEAT
eukprot:TRINITY_DN6066_c2_g1_i1.p1 TRINITY_DN6066_c2_g1~~TRINITY_DN6066_c2_g1_i1.p1  ORF type:complete len:249 (+),score=62.14 TRINITY_DN6066_c2_g1_i1:63-809(+)